MAELENRKAAMMRGWALGAASVALAIAGGGLLRAQSPTPANPTVPLAKARQLQFDGDLRTAEQIAQSDLKQPGGLSQLAGSLELLTSIYKQSGRFEEALTTGTRYQQLLEKVPNADPSKRQDIHLLLAEILAGLEKYPQAVAQVDDALKIADGWRGTDPLWEAHAYALRAQIERAAGQVDAASVDWREVESRMRSVLDQIDRTGPNTDLEESALKLLTEALVSTGRTAEAIATRQQLLARHEDDYTRGRNWSEIANCYALLRQDAQEERALRTALALEAGHDQPRSKADVADLLDRLGVVLEHRGDLAEARSRWKESAAIYQQLVDERTGHRGRSERQITYLAKLQAIFEHLNQWPEAIRAGTQLLAQRSQTMLPDDPKLWHIKSALGGLYARAGDAEKARPLLVDALAYSARPGFAPTIEIAQTLIPLTKVSLAEGDRQQALVYAEDAVKVCQPPAGHETLLAEAYDKLGDVQAAEGDDQSAIDQYQQAVRICRARPNDRRSNLILCGSLVNIAAVYKSRHEYGRAAEYCAQALDVRQRAPGKDPLALIGLHIALATLQLADDQVTPAGRDESTQLAEAEKNIEAARRLCEEQGLLDESPGIGVLELQAVVDVRRDKPEAARKALDEALALARRSKQPVLEAKILTQLAGLDGRNGSAAGADLPAKP